MEKCGCMGKGGGEGGRQRDGHRNSREGTQSSIEVGTLPGRRLATRRETQDHRGGRRLLRPSTHTQAKYHQPHRSGVGCKPAYGTLGQETRGEHWSANSRRVGIFPTDRRWGTDDGGPDTGGGRLNTLKWAERRQIGRKERGDGQDSVEQGTRMNLGGGGKGRDQTITTGNIEP